MIQEIFVVEDKEDIINELKGYFKGSKELVLKHVSSRRFV